MTISSDIYCYSILYTQTGYTRYVFAHNIRQVLSWGHTDNLNINEATIEEVSKVLGPTDLFLDLYTFTLVKLDVVRKVSVLSESVQSAFDRVTERYVGSKVVKIEKNEMIYADLTKNITPPVLSKQEDK